MAQQPFTEAGFDATFDKKQSIKYGAILGVISLIFGIAIYHITPYTSSFWMSTIVSKLLNEGVYIIFSLLFAYAMRKNYGGSWNFTVALKSTFLMLFISTLIGVLGTEVYVTYINTDIQRESLEHTMNLAIESMENEKIAAETIDARIIDFEKTISELENKTIGSVLRGLAIAVLLQFIFSLFLAALTRNEKLAPRSNNLN